MIFSSDYGLGLINGASNGNAVHAADVDDAYAVSLAIANGLDVATVVTLFGNDKAQPSQQSAVRSLNQTLDCRIDVRLGAQSIFSTQPISFQPPLLGVPFFCINDGVEQMRLILMDEPANSVTVFAIGPFTDIACLQRAYATAFARIKEIVALVGSLNGTLFLQGNSGNISVPDFNFAMDPVALGQVLQSGAANLTFIMFEVSKLGSIANTTFSQWIQNGTTSEKFYGAASLPHANYWHGIFPDAFQALFDAHTVYYHLNESRYVCDSNMTATATTSAYPTASLSANTLAVVSGGPAPVSPPSTTYWGKVKGCFAFQDSASVQAIETAIIASVEGAATVCTVPPAPTSTAAPSLVLTSAPTMVPTPSVNISTPAETPTPTETSSPSCVVCPPPPTPCPSASSSSQLSSNIFALVLMFTWGVFA